MKYINDKFKYDRKETYTQADLEVILERAEGFIDVHFKDHKNPEEYKKLLDELAPLKAEKRNAFIRGLVKDFTDEDKITDAIELAKLTDEDTDETIKSKVKETIEKRPFLQKEAVDDPAAKRSKEEVVVKKVSGPKPEDLERIKGL